jgi:hypothetical protein
MQHYVIKFVSDLRQVGGLLWVLRFPSIKKTDCHDIAEILMKVGLKTTRPLIGDCCLTPVEKYFNYIHYEFTNK